MIRERRQRPRVESLEGRDLPATLIATGPTPAAEVRPALAENGPLFNGRNLNGFRIGDVALGRLKRSPDGRFEVARGMLLVNPGPGIVELTSTRPTPRRFTLTMEFRAGPSADSGVFIRGVQLQVRDYPRVGPYTELDRFRDGGWNRLKIVVRPDGAGGATATCTCNGEILEVALRVPTTGPIGFQAESGLFAYRNIRLRADR